MHAWIYALHVCVRACVCGCVCLHEGSNIRLFSDKTDIERKIGSNEGSKHRRADRVQVSCSIVEMHSNKTRE